MKESIIKVLVVDDSAFMRKAIKSMLEGDPYVEVVGVARDGLEAVEKVATLRPDVVTMDIEMPRMTGLEAVKAIMEKHPVPILMLSSLTESGAKATFDALDMGAVDYVPKHLDDLSSNIMKVKNELVAKVKAVAKRRVKRITGRSEPTPSPMAPQVIRNVDRRFVSQRIAIVAIGASTGGPRAIQSVLEMIPSNFPVCIIIAIHMPQNFTGAFADRLNGLCVLEVKEASDGDSISPGKVFISPGGWQTRVRKRGAIDVDISIDNNPPGSIYKPSVDITLLSVAKCFPGRALGVILTGMGYDGKEGIKAIKQTGGKTLAQDEESSIVYGMPKAIVDEGLADKVISLDKMAGEIVNMV